MQSDTAREALREKSVGDIFEANRAVKTADYLGAEKRKTEAEAYALEHPEIGFTYAAGLKFIDKMKHPAEIEYLRGQAYHAYQAGNLNKVQWEDLNSQFGLRAEELKLKNEYQQILNQEHGAFTLGGETFYAPTANILDFLKYKSTSGGDSKAGIDLEKHLDKVESHILQNKDSASIVGYVDTWNKYSDKPYVYTYNDRFLGSNLQKVPIPPINGRQLNAFELNVLKRQAERDAKRAIEWHEFFRIINPNGKLPTPERIGNTRIVTPGYNPGLGPEYPAE